jgi:hypothetical protein
MERCMWTVDETAEVVCSGKSLFVAGDESALSKLPKGQWIGGTIPYFMADDGGQMDRDLVNVTVMPDYILDLNLKTCDENTLKNVYTDAPRNGFSLVIIPGMSQAHLSFGLNAPAYDDFALRPLIGWISGIHMDDLGKVSPKVFYGPTAESFSDRAVVMHSGLPDNKAAELEVANIFKPGDGDSIVFFETGFSAREAMVSGKKRKLVEYLDEIGVDDRLPLVANYYGTMINTSFQSIDRESGLVSFYAPVFKGLEYKQARPFEDYVTEFLSMTPKDAENVLWSCNCILNYLYSELKDKKTGNFKGPITFGEIAYQLMNQTLVFLRINDV